MKQIFSIGKVGNIAGCACTDGDIVKAGNVRVLRGAKIVFNSLAAPVCQIAKNCGIEGQIVLSKVIDKDFGYGFNAANFEYGDLFDAGVVDSAQVTLSALENSASIAGLVLTTEALIHEIPQDLSEDEKLAAMDAAAGMGGMDYM